MQKLSFTLLITALLFTSCAFNKKLSFHKDFLSKLATSNASPQKKLDGLLENYVVMMEQGLGFVNPAQGVKFVQKYHEQNEQALDSILGDVQQWQMKMSDMEMMSYGMGLLGKPYTKKAIDLFPKFERKYKQVAFVMKLSDKVKNGVVNIGKKRLGGN